LEIHISESAELDATSPLKNLWIGDSYVWIGRSIEVLRMGRFSHGVITGGLLGLCSLQILNLRFEFRDPFKHRPDSRCI